MADAANEEFQFLSNRPEPFGETDLFPEKSDENLWEVWEAIGFQSKEELGRFMGGLAKANEKEMLEVGRMLAERTKAGVPHPVCCTQMPPKKPVLMMRFQLEDGNQFGVHEPVPLMPRDRAHGPLRCGASLGKAPVRGCGLYGGA